MAADRCPSILAGFICSDDICRNASEETQCGAFLEDYAEDIWEEDDSADLD